MALQPSYKRYIGWAKQSAKGTPATAPTIALPVVKSQSKFLTNMNLQDEKYSTGDLFILVDGIPVKPLITGVTVIPFKPHVLNAFLASMCYLNGDLAIPDWCTFFVGDGYNEKKYSDVLMTTAEMNCDDGAGPALWTHNFLGLQPAVPGTMRDVTSLIPVYERSFRMVNLLPATILTNTTKNNIEVLKWMIGSGVTAYYGSRGDGKEGPGDLIINELSAGMDITMGAEDDLVRLAYVNACGAPGDFLTKFQTNCSGTTYSHSFELDNGLIHSDEQDSPDDLPINEPFTVRGLRSSAVGHPSPAKIVLVP